MSPIKKSGFAVLDAPESRRGLLTGAVTVICVAVLLVTAMRNPVDYDGYWHLRMGMDWIVNGLSPWVDHYSFTYKGEPISNVPYMFQVALFGMVSLFGDTGGMIALKLLLFLFILACMIGWLERIKAPVLAYILGLTLVVIAVQLRAQVRPELFSYGLMIIAFILYDRAQLRLSVGAMAPVVIFTLFWVNYHSAVLAYVIFFGLFVDIALRLLKERAPIRQWLPWAGWGVVIVAVGYLQPGFTHPAFALLGGFMEDWGPLIQEYLPPTYYIGTTLGYFLPLIALLTALGLLWQRKIGLLIVTLVFLWSGFTIGRMVAPATLVCAILLPLIIRDWQRGLHAPVGKKTGSTNGIKAIAATAAGLSLFSLLLGVRIAQSYLDENLHSWTSFPQAIVTHFESRGYSGRIFNDYETGGYLLYKLAPESEIYIDGRTGILYPMEHHLRYVQARRFANAFVEEHEQHDFQFSVMQRNEDTVTMMDAAGWHLEFVDMKFLLYRPNEGRFSQFGRLWASPYCWSEKTGEALAVELAYLRPNSGSSIPPTVPLMYYSLAYTLSADPAEFIRTMAHDYDEDDAGRRFFAGRALTDGVPGVAIDLAAKIERREPLDDLVPVLAHGHNGAWDEAQAAMAYALDQPWRVLTEDEQRLQLELLDWIARHLPLSTPLDERRVSLSSAVSGRPGPAGENLPIELCLN